MKQALHQMQGPRSVEDKLSRFLLKYHITPHSTTSVAPCELLMGHRLRSRLDLLHPEFTMSRREYYIYAIIIFNYYYYFCNVIFVIAVMSLIKLYAVYIFRCVCIVQLSSL